MAELRRRRRPVPRVRVTSIRWAIARDQALAAAEGQRLPVYDFWVAAVSDPHGDYYGQDKDVWRPVRVKKAWVPEFVWAFVADLYNLGWHWPAVKLTEEPR